MSKKARRKKFNINKRGRFKEQFDVNKFKRSLKRSGLSKSLRDELIAKIDPKKACYKSTASLFRKTHKEIYKKSKKLAAHYNIKRSIFELGPTGYPFEILSAEILKTKGFKTQVSVVKQGQFVKHEVDVVAKRPDLTIFCECKFHRNQRFKNDIKLPLYIHSRYLDLKNSQNFGEIQYAIMTNTNFSRDAINYSKGVGLLLFSLDYPSKGTFLDLMKRYKVYPVTILKNLKKREAAQLLQHNIVVIKHLKPLHLQKIGLDKIQISHVMGEVKALLN
jgi:hypothetical protein